VVCSAPTIKTRIGRAGEITGNFSGPRANDLAIALNSGSMPVPLNEEYTGVVGASLGGDSIRKGLVAAITGLTVVLVFMMIYYRLAGLVANVALFLNGFIMLAAFAYFRLTLTLPGIAGFVLTMGMAVDANVLIFERVREEVRNGKSLISAIEQGYKRATVTILDANVTTLIAALVLLQFGTGPVQGFGVALAIGICSSVFTALVVSRAVFDVLINRKMLKKLTMMSLLKPEIKLPFIENRKKAYIASVSLVAIGFIAFLGRGYENNFGVDFASGTNMVINLENKEPVDIENVRQELIAAGFTDTIVQNYGAGGELQQNTFMIRTGETQAQQTPTAEPSPEVVPPEESSTPEAAAPEAAAPEAAAIEAAPEAAAPEAGVPEAAPEAAPEAGVPEAAPEAAAPEAAPASSGEGDPDVENPGEASTAVSPAYTSGAVSATSDLESRVQEALAPLCDEVLIEKVESVGPAIGSQLRKDALKAVTYSLIFMIAYMWFRYNLVFGLAAIVALLHDSLICVGLLSLTGRHIDMNVVAAVLTIIGYSVNDTVVVYDRIRENLRLYIGRGLSFGEIINLAINQTLSRTILTGGTTLLTVLMLFLFGGEVLNNFAFYLMVGILVGTYSSIFVASSLVYTVQLYQKGNIGFGGKKTPPKKGAKAKKKKA